MTDVPRPLLDRLPPPPPFPLLSHNLFLSQTEGLDAAKLTAFSNSYRASTFERYSFTLLLELLFAFFFFFLISFLSFCCVLLFGAFFILDCFHSVFVCFVIDDYDEDYGHDVYDDDVDDLEERSVRRPSKIKRRIPVTHH